MVVKIDMYVRTSTIYNNNKTLFQLTKYIRKNKITNITIYTSEI